MGKAYNVTVTSNPILSGKVCPYCSQESKLVNSSIIYGKDYGMMYLCEPCDAYVGTHDGTIISKGRLANSSLRALKKEAHRYFDKLWEKKMKVSNIKKGKARELAYDWLSRELGVPRTETHIGFFDDELTKKTIELCLKYFKK